MRVWRRCMVVILATAVVPAGAQVLTLEQCLETAMKNSRRRPASMFAVAMAEAQHRQALSAYWPQVDLKAGYQRLDEPLNFVFPSSAVPIPVQSIAVPGGYAMVTIPAGAFAPGFPPSTVQLPVRVQLVRPHSGGGATRGRSDAGLRAGAKNGCWSSKTTR